MARPLRPLSALGLPEARVLAVEGLARMLLATRATFATAAGVVHGPASTRPC